MVMEYLVAFGKNVIPVKLSYIKLILLKIHMYVTHVIIIIDYQPEID